MEFSDGSTLDFKVSVGRVSSESGSVWDTAQWNVDDWDGGADVDFSDLSSRVQSMRTRRGKDRFGKRFRTGTAVLVLNNEDGLFSLMDSAFNPGDIVKIEGVFTAGGDPDEFPQDIPDATVWDGETGREWTAHGSLVLDDDLPPGLPVTFGLFRGRVHSSIDRLRRGVDVTTVVASDGFADLARIDKAAQPDAGAGELSNARVTRVLNNAGQGFDSHAEIGTFFHTMAATDLDKVSLEELQLTMDTEGGDVWMDTTGEVTIAGRDWLTTQLRSTETQWLLGALSVGVEEARPSRSVELMVNDAVYQNVGGVVQTAEDTLSKTRFGTQSRKRIDLLGDLDLNAQFLATRVVANLSAVRPRVREVTMPVVNRDTADLGLGVLFGDLAIVIVSSIHDWGMAFAAHVIGISNSMVDDEWTVTLTLDDAFVDNVDGGFDFEAFSEGFSLGGQP